MFWLRNKKNNFLYTLLSGGGGCSKYYINKQGSNTKVPHTKRASLNSESTKLYHPLELTATETTGDLNSIYAKYLNIFLKKNVVNFLFV